MKRCPACRETKPLSEFHRNTLRRDGVQSICKMCRAALDRDRYARERDVRSRRNREFIRGRTEWLRSLKVGRPCTDCGKVFPPEAMQFDHLPGTLKQGDVSTLTGRSMRGILQEIAKCELVCANCHVIRTFKRAGWTLREAPGRYVLLGARA